MYSQNPKPSKLSVPSLRHQSTNKAGLNPSLMLSLFEKANGFAGQSELLTSRPSGSFTLSAQRCLRQKEMTTNAGGIT